MPSGAMGATRSPGQHRRAGRNGNSTNVRGRHRPPPCISVRRRCQRWLIPRCVTGRRAIVTNLPRVGEPAPGPPAPGLPRHSADENEGRACRRRHRSPAPRRPDGRPSVTPIRSRRWYSSSAAGPRGDGSQGRPRACSSGPVSWHSRLLQPANEYSSSRMAWYSTRTAGSVPSSPTRRCRIGSRQRMKVPYTERFLFPPQGDTRDPDSLVSS
jgi:hypothetical protein